MKTARKNRHGSTLTRSILAEIYLGMNTTNSELVSKAVLKGGRDNDLTIFTMESPEPSRFDDWRDFFREYSAASLCSKADFLDLGIDRAAVAIEKFLRCEETCYALNVKFKHPDVTPQMGVAATEVFHLARRKIGRVLGDFSWDEVGRLAAFGPGAAVGVSRKRSHVVDKFGLERPTVTGECATLAEAFIKTSPQWSTTVPVFSGRTEDCFEIVQGSRITTVPKSAKTDRVIAIEPLMNMFFQKGIGSCIRSRLRTVGVNLNDQTRNQNLAMRGSISGKLATIDLASASDSISRGLVEWLVPSEWVTAMKICRSTRCTLPSGETKLLQKFSSMGNGYTFELESLIFWALSSAVLLVCGEGSRDLAVYGDDIIVPSAVSGLLIEVLAEAGFSTNSDKSFVFGPFRESCGKHFFLGHDVTPLYIRKDIEDPERLLWTANSVRRLSHRFIGADYGCCSRLKRAYDFIVRSLPPYLRKLSIPEGFGDGGLVRDFDESRPRRHRCFDAFITRHVRREYSSFRPCNQPVLTAALFQKERQLGDPLTFSLSDVSGRMSVNVRDVVPLEKSTSRYRLRVIKLVVDKWYGLGPWVAGF
jgi:hypothetical protein